VKLSLLLRMAKEEYRQLTLHAARYLPVVLLLL